jgi:hypothetical protein
MAKNSVFLDFYVAEDTLGYESSLKCRRGPRPTGASAEGTYAPDAPFVLLGHNTPADVPVEEFPTGGLFKNTPASSAMARYSP